MKKSFLITIIVVAILLIGGGVLFFIMNIDDDKEGVICPDFDGDKQGCLSYSECKWSSDMNECDSADMRMVDEGDEDDGDDENGGGLIQNLENIPIPNNPSNELCKKLPLSNHSPYGERYYCLALVNHDERFCEGIDEENDKKYLSSPCKCGFFLL